MIAGLSTFLVAAVADLGRWSVVAREPVCILGAALPDRVIFSLEYHPRSDTYHLLFGGPMWDAAEDGRAIRISIGTMRSGRSFTGRTIRQAPEVPGALYIPLTRAPDSRRYGRTERPNDFIEELLSARSSLRISVAGKDVVRLPRLNSRRSVAALARCADRFSSVGKSPASFRLLRAGLLPPGAQAPKGEGLW